MAMRQAPVQAVRSGPDVIRGALAAAVIVILVGGVPWALSAFVGWPLPASIPSWSEITTALGDSYIPDTFLAKALAVVCWIVWIELVASLLVEAVAVVRGRQAGKVPLTGPVQRLVARLVAAVSLMVILLVTRPDSTVQAVPVPAPAVTAGLAATGAEPGEVASDTNLATYVVQRRDTLWGIAEAHLRDPFRWVEIWERNQGRAQPDGATMVDPDRIYAGWTLELPGDAVGLGPSGSTALTEVGAAGRAGSEAMTPLGPGAGEATSDRATGGETLAVSGGGTQDRMEVMVPLDPGTAGPRGPESLLASGTSETGPGQGADPADPATGEESRSRR